MSALQQLRVALCARPAPPRPPLGPSPSVNRIAALCVPPVASRWRPELLVRILSSLGSPPLAGTYVSHHRLYRQDTVTLRGNK